MPFRELTGKEEKPSHAHEKASSLPEKADNLSTLSLIFCKKQQEIAHS
jgi:hypothetical protein